MPTSKHERFIKAAEEVQPALPLRLGLERTVGRINRWNVERGCMVSSKIAPICHTSSPNYIKPTFHGSESMLTAF